MSNTKPSQNEVRGAIQGEVLRIIEPKLQAGVVVSMRVGKCYIGLQDMARKFHETCKFLVAAPKTEIFQSWKDDAKKFGMEGLLDHITFTTYLSLPKQTHDYDTVYLDECHSLKFKHGDWLSIYEKRHGGRTIGLTGTYPENVSSEKYKMCQRFCPKVYEYLTDEAVRDGILNDYRIKVHCLKLDPSMTLKKTTKQKKDWLTSEQKQYDYWTQLVNNSDGEERKWASIQRMKEMQAFPSKEKYAKKLISKMKEKTLVFANTIDQAERLSVNSFHSKAKKKSKISLDLFKKGAIMLLSCVEQLSEGVTVPGLKESLIMHSYGNNRRAAQKIGRTLGLSPDEIATINILCYEGTKDEEWVKAAIKAFDDSKIEWIKPQ